MSSDPLACGYCGNLPRQPNFLLVQRVKAYHLDMPKIVTIRVSFAWANFCWVWSNYRGVLTFNMGYDHGGIFNANKLEGSQPDIYVLTQQEILEAINMMAGMIYLNGCPLTILFDMGALIYLWLSVS